MSDAIGDNLRLLCSHYRSIAEVCRKLSINRAQFNKYLSGQSRPTAYNLKRICDFFGVEEYELGLPAEQFARLVGARGASDSPAAGDPLLELLQPLRQHAASLERYCGYYFEYANCMSVPGRILLSLVQLREERGSYLFERQERQERARVGEAEDWVRCRYLGARTGSRRPPPTGAPATVARSRERTCSWSTRSSSRSNGAGRRSARVAA